MTAILEEIRRLEAARARGDLSGPAFEAAKARLMGSVEEADTTAEPAPAPPKAETFKVFDVVIFCLFATLLCVVLGTLLIGDLTLAVTLALTLLAAFTIRAFITLDD